MRSASITAATFATSFLLTASHAAADVLITIDKSNQHMSVEVDGVSRWSWPVSTGRIGHETPSGSFKPIWTDAEHISKEWDNAPMPYSIFFTENGHAIHGTASVRQLGTPASHGCVRLARENAEKLYAVVREQGLANTRVVLTGDASLAAAAGTHSAPTRRAVSGQVASIPSPAEKRSASTASPTVAARPRSLSPWCRLSRFMPNTKHSALSGRTFPMTASADPRALFARS